MYLLFLVGCEGNENNFLTMNECYGFCSDLTMNYTAEGKLKLGFHLFSKEELTHLFNCIQLWRWSNDRKILDQCCPWTVWSVVGRTGAVVQVGSISFFLKNQNLSKFSSLIVCYLSSKRMWQERNRDTNKKDHHGEQIWRSAMSKEPCGDEDLFQNMLNE